MLKKPPGPAKRWARGRLQSEEAPKKEKRGLHGKKKENQKGRGVMGDLVVFQLDKKGKNKRGPAGGVGGKRAKEKKN